MSRQLCTHAMSFPFIVAVLITLLALPAIPPGSVSHSFDNSDDNESEWVCQSKTGTYATATELDELRPVPRFKEMLKRMNLPEQTA